MRGIELAGRAVGGLKFHELHRKGRLCVADGDLLRALTALEPASELIAVEALEQHRSREGRYPKTGYEIAAFFFDDLLPQIHGSGMVDWPNTPIDLMVTGLGGARIHPDGTIERLTDRLAPADPSRRVTLNFDAFVSLASSFLPEDRLVSIQRTNSGAQQSPLHACAALYGDSDCLENNCIQDDPSCWLLNPHDPNSDCHLDICIWQLREGCALDQTCSVEHCGQDACHIDVCNQDSCAGAACYWAACAVDVCGAAACGADLCGAAICGADLGVIPCPVDGCPVAAG